MVSPNALNTPKCTEHTLHRVCMCTQENTSVILQPSSNFGVIKSFHNGPIETTDVLNGNVSDENLYTAQKISLLLDTIIMQNVPYYEVKLEKFDFRI